MLRIDLLHTAHAAGDDGETATRARPKNPMARVVAWLQHHTGPRAVTWTASSALACLGIASGMVVLYQTMHDQQESAMRAHASAATDSAALAGLVDSLTQLRMTADSALAWQRRQAATSPTTTAAFVAIADEPSRRGVRITRVQVHPDGAVSIEGSALSVSAVVALMQQLPAPLLRNPRIDQISSSTSDVADRNSSAAPARAHANGMPLLFRVIATISDAASQSHVSQ